MSDEKAALRAEVARLRARIEEADDWAHGIQTVLALVLPALLRGHPEAGKVQALLQMEDDRYEELQKHPDRAEPNETAAQHEAGKMLHRLLALGGVWPNVDHQQAVRESLRRARSVPPEKR